MNFIPLVYEILPGLRSSRFPATYQPREIPGRVITLLTGGRDRLLHESKPVLKHQEGFFFEDKTHDWHVDEGSNKFYYFSRTIAPEVRGDERADVLALYQWIEQVPSDSPALAGQAIFHGCTSGLRYKIKVERSQPDVSGSQGYWVLRLEPLELNKLADTEQIKSVLNGYGVLLRHASTEVNALNEADSVREKEAIEQLCSPAS